MYKRFWLVMLLALALALPARASTQDFTINSFTADYYLSRASDGVAEMRIAETIVADFPDFDQNHGILRALPQTYQGHGLELHVESVHKTGGTDWPYSTSTDNGNTVLQIGDPDVYVHGQQTYLITYTVRGVANDEQNDSNLFWNVNGDQWPQTFGPVTARLHIPKNLVNAVQTNNVACFTGRAGATQTDCTSSLTPDGDGLLLSVRTLRALNGYETLSFKVGLTQSAFHAYQMSASYLWSLIILGFVLVAPTPLAAWWVWRRWRVSGRDAKGKGVIVPQYIPPKEVSVLGSSAVLKERFVPAALSAAVIDLVVRHYLKIYETGKHFGKFSYSIELVKLPKDLRLEEQQIVDMLFGISPQIGTLINLDTLSKKLYTQAQQIGHQINVDLTKQGFFVQNPDRARLPYFIASGVLAAAAFLYMPYTLGLLGASAACLIGAAIMAARTPKGAELKDYLLGLRDYMKLAEAERLRVLQSPHGELTQKIDVADKGTLITLYEHLLPYAMLFGIEKDWARQLASLYTQPPDWYSGSGAFNAVYFASAMSGFSAQTTQSFTPPSSSGGSGAGGGGGGGGGGGW